MAVAMETAVDAAGVEGCVNRYGMTPMTHASSLSWIVALVPNVEIDRRLFCRSLVEINRRLFCRSTVGDEHVRNES